MTLNLTILLVSCAVLCFAENLRTNYIFDGVNAFKDAAYSIDPVTDKVTTHSYQKMYGTVLLPMVEKFSHEEKSLKFLEIGLGCGMQYGPGASVKVWQEIFKGRNVDMWEAEFDAKCVKKASEEGKLEGFKTVTGDQADPAVLKRWIEETHGEFDVIIDDGGHVSKQVLNSFVALWPELNPDGNYFIEDLQVAHLKSHTAKGVPPVTKVIQAWIEALHVGAERAAKDHKKILSAYPLPEGLEWILCQTDACVLHKSPVTAIV